MNGVVIYTQGPAGRKPQRWYVQDTKKDFHMQYGVIPKEKLKPGVVKVGSIPFHIVPASFLDGIKSIKRKAQIITRKDIGFIIGWCGLNRDSIVVESGAGSGGATVALAGVCDEVFSYEIEKEYIEIVKKNLEKINLKNVTITHADFYDAKNVRNHKADLVLLDLPEPWQTYNSVLKTLVLGGYVVAYTPTIVQAQQFVNELPEEFLHESTLEVIDRQWKVKGRAVRPVSGDIGHTAFLTVVRRIQK